MKIEAPDRKVAIGAGAIGLPVGVIITWALQEFAGVVVPAEVGAAIGSLASVIAAYLLPNG